MYFTKPRTFNGYVLGKVLLYRMTQANRLLGHTAGSTVDEATYLFSALENQCHAQLMVEAASANKSLQKAVIADEDASFTAATLQHWENVYVNFQPEYNLLVRERGDFFLK